MDDDEDEVANAWPMKLFVVLLGSLIMGYGIWCLYSGRAYIIGRFTGLTTYDGAAAEFIAWSDICLASIFFAALIPFKNKKALRYLFSILFLLFLALSGIGIFY